MGPEGVAEVVAAAGEYGLQPCAEDPADERLDDVWDWIGGGGGGGTSQMGLCIAHRVMRRNHCVKRVMRRGKVACRPLTKDAHPLARLEA